ERAHHARWGQLQALERTEPMDPSQLEEKSKQLFLVAHSTKAAGKTSAYYQLVQQAYDLAPNYVPATLAMAEFLIERKRFIEAHNLLDNVLSKPLEQLTDEQRVIALYGQGITLREMGQSDEARAAFSHALRLQPLHGKCLVALGELQTESKRTAAALEHFIRALIVVKEPLERGKLFYQIGKLWEDEMGRSDQAGICYELALTEGLSNRDLLVRSLRHFERTGRLDQTMQMVNELLPTAHDPDELSTLWFVQGEIHAANEDDQAIQAFDMALSYNPNNQEARNGLIRVLEQREDWNQVLQVLEAGCDVGAPVQRAQAFKTMADICMEKLDDPEGAERYLRRSIDALPTRSALELLLQLYQTPEKHSERIEVIGHLVQFGPPWFERCIELSKLLLKEDARWAWCLLSPLLGVSQIEPELKALVQNMRKQSEQPSILVPASEDKHLLVHNSEYAALTKVLAELEPAVQPVGISTLEGVDDGNAVRITTSTHLGKAFQAMADAIGLPDVTLYRSQSIEESICIVNSSPNPSIVLQTEIIQQLVHAEIGFLLGYALELAQPGNRVMSAFRQPEREALLPALWQSLGFGKGANRWAKALAEQIRQTTDDETRRSWTEQLQSLRNEDPFELGRKWWESARKTARRTGLLAGADLRQVFRVVSRQEGGVPKPHVVSRLEDLDEYVSQSEILQDLVAFAASPRFGQLLGNARTITPES
ncbi:MAG: tetratricopeptide repeat protein, partial [Pseudomonadota bacterium]